METLRKGCVFVLLHEARSEIVVFFPVKYYSCKVWKWALLCFFPGGRTIKRETATEDYIVGFTQDPVIAYFGFLIPQRVTFSPIHLSDNPSLLRHTRHSKIANKKLDTDQRMQFGWGITSAILHFIMPQQDNNAPDMLIHWCSAL